MMMMTTANWCDGNDWNGGNKDSTAGRDEESRKLQTGFNCGFLPFCPSDSSRDPETCMRELSVCDCSCNRCSRNAISSPSGCLDCYLQ